VLVRLQPQRYYRCTSALATGTLRLALGRGRHESRIELAGSWLEADTLAIALRGLGDLLCQRMVPIVVIP
jgi:hypothetical protein